MVLSPFLSAAALAVWVIPSTGTAATQPIIYVDAAAAGLNSGTSWPDAFTDLEPGLQAAASLGGAQVWIATGVYRPSARTDPADSHSATFQLRSGVALYGGFRGGEASLGDRSLDSAPTILSGDLLGNDGPLGDLPDATRMDNATHVVTCRGADASAVLDGVNITGGCAFVDAFEEPAHVIRLNSGAGLFCDSASPTIRACTFRGNITWSRHRTQGAGMLVLEGSPHLSDCTFENNVAYGAEAFSSGGGLCSIAGAPTLVDCIFRANRADGYDSEHMGGAIENRDGQAVITRCVFLDNRSHFGGAVCDEGAGGSILTECTFVGNWSHNAGGALSVGPDAGTQAFDCRFARNASDFGGALHSAGDTAAFRGCSFIDNDGYFGGGAHIRGDSTIANCLLRGNTASFGGGICVEYLSSPRLTGCMLIANSAASGGGVYNSGRSSPLLVNCSLIANLAVLDQPRCGGGGVFNDEAAPTFLGCLFSGNTAPGAGGAMLNFSSRNGTCQVRLANCTFAGNRAAVGNSMANAADPGAAVGEVTIRNSILRDGLAGIAVPDPALIDVAYSNVQGGWSGLGNVDADPLFVDDDGRDAIRGTPDDDLRLRVGSPCIDSGDNAAAPPELRVDLDGRARFADVRRMPDTGSGDPPIVDMGAYERVDGVRADFDGDGDVDLDDFGLFQTCFGGPAVLRGPRCSEPDFDEDQDVDQEDFGSFQRCFSGPDAPAEPACAG